MTSRIISARRRICAPSTQALTSSVVNEPACRFDGMVQAVEAEKQTVGNATPIRLGRMHLVHILLCRCILRVPVRLNSSWSAWHGAQEVLPDFLTSTERGIPHLTRFHAENPH